jgi:asparagine synthetase B (glutamine-hydrolysing)
LNYADHLRERSESTRPDDEPASSLLGAIAFGGMPRLEHSRRCRLWPGVVTLPDYEIAIDGYFVLGERLYLGRSDAERIEIGNLIAADLRKFLAQVQNGCFNIVVNDLERRRTLFASDGFGAQPLYLARLRDTLAFGSTYPALRQASGNARFEADDVGLAELYWFGYQFGDRTAYRGVEHMPHGTILTVRWNDGSESRERWCDDDQVTPNLPASHQEMAEQVLGLMAASVRRLKPSEAVYGAKISAGMDSRLICGTWDDPNVRAYTYGYSGAAEVRLAAQLAAALGMPHRFVPLHGDFFTRYHAPLFARHGITEWFHQALMPPMIGDGIELALDGLLGDIVLGGTTLKRRSHGQWREALGLPPRHDARQLSDEEMADYIFAQHGVPDHAYRPLTADSVQRLESCRPAVRADLAAEVKKARALRETPEQIFTEVLYRSRFRRYVSLQGALCRPAIEPLYPFLDRDIVCLRGRIPPEWQANKRLYIDMYSRFLPKIRAVPGLYSLLPFTFPERAHYLGRVYRYGMEQLGLSLSYLTAGKWNLWPANGVQWARWMAFDRPFREGTREFMRPSSAFDNARFDTQAEEIAAGRAKPAGTRWMLTASYCGHFR